MEIFDRADEVINVLLYLQRFYLISASQLNCCSDWISVFYRVSLGNNRTSYFNNWRKEGTHRRLAVVKIVLSSYFFEKREGAFASSDSETFFAHFLFSQFSFVFIDWNPQRSSKQFHEIQWIRRISFWSNYSLMSARTSSFEGANCQLGP